MRYAHIFHGMGPRDYFDLIEIKVSDFRSESDDSEKAVRNLPAPLLIESHADEKASPMLFPK